MKKVLVLVVSIFLFAVSSAWGTTLDIDVTGSSCEIQSSDTIRVRQINVSGASYYADFKWNNTTYKFEPVNANTDTLSVVGKWSITHDWDCNSGTDVSYITLKSDHTIGCWQKSASDTTCNQTYYIYTGTWSLSGNTLTIYVNTSYNSWQHDIYNNSKWTGTLNGGANYNGIQDGKIYQKNSSTYEYTDLKGCWTATRSTE